MAGGHSETAILPSDWRSSVGAYSPSCCLLHHVPCARFSSGVVNQYCQTPRVFAAAEHAGTDSPKKAAAHRYLRGANSPLSAPRLAPAATNSATQTTNSNRTAADTARKSSAPCLGLAA